MNDILKDGLFLSYNLVVLAGTAYLVQEKGWTPWWFLLSVMLLAVPK